MSHWRREHRGAVVTVEADEPPEHDPANDAEWVDVTPVDTPASTEAQTDGDSTPAEDAPAQEGEGAQGEGQEAPVPQAQDQEVGAPS